MFQHFFFSRKVLLVLNILLLSHFQYSQNFIKGVVVDSTNHELAFVNIALVSVNDSVTKKGTISNENGQFELLNIKQGNYHLEFFSVGYNKFVSEEIAIDSTSSIILEKIIMLNQGINLNEVSVTSMKKTIEFKNGMTVMNVENSIMASGNTALDVLKRIPGVTVDNKNNISISGKQGVRVMLDGRMQQLSMEQVISILSAMSSDQLSKIEVMKNPPVKYDSQGNAGIINIVTKKVKTKGYSGSINYNPGMGQRFGNSMYAALNFKSNKLTIYSNINPMYKTFYDRYDFHKNVLYKGNTTIFDQTGEHENLRKYISGKFGLDYSITKKTTVGLVISSTINDTHPIERGDVSINGFNDMGFDQYQFVNDEKALWTSPGCNLNIEHKFDTMGTVLSLAADYMGFNNSSDRRSESVFLSSPNANIIPSLAYKTTNQSHVEIFTQKIDFQKNLSTSWFLETGAKTTFVNNNTDFVFQKRDPLTHEYHTDTAFTNIYLYKETLIAGYINFRKQLKKGSLSVGVRAENTEITGKNTTSGFTLTKSYLNFFPNLSFDYQLSEKHLIQFNYNRRLDRPNYSQLNPFKRFEDQYVSTVGNPYLNPQYSDNFDMVYVFNQWATNSIGYAHITNILTDMNYQIDSTKQTIQMPVNLNQNNYYYYNLFLHREIKKWWSAEISLNVFYSNFKSQVGSATLNTNAVSCNLYFNNDFILPKNFKIQLTAHYNAPNTYAAYYNKANGSCDLGIKKALYKGRFNIMFQFLDMFYTDYTRVEYKFDNQYNYYRVKDDTRRFRLTLNYKFGKMNIRMIEKNSNQQETGRLKKD